MKLNKAKEDYARDGYAVIPQVFSEDWSRYVSEANDLVARYPGSVQFRQGHPALFFWPIQHSAILDALARSKPMEDIVRTFLGDEVRLVINQIYYRRSGDGDEFAWHQDKIFRPSDHFVDIDTHYLQTIICLQDIEDNGAIEFIPGSHKSYDESLVQRDGESLRRFIRGEKRGLKLKAKAGDVLIWHPLVVHGSEQNHSGKGRMTFMSGFASDRAVIRKDQYPRYL